MTPKKKPARGPAPERARDHARRDVVGGATRSLSYPTAREWIAVAAIAAGFVSSGCADPVCSSSRIDELTSHGRIAAEQLTDLELRAGLESLGVATGITPHPASIPLPGAMIMPLPLLPEETPEETPEESTGTDEKD